MKVIAVSYFPGDEGESSGGGFDWYLDEALGCQKAREHVQILLGAPEYRRLPDTCVTVRRLNVPIDPTIRGWQDAVTQWLDENPELRELPDGPRLMVAALDAQVVELLDKESAMENELAKLRNLDRKQRERIAELSAVAVRLENVMQAMRRAIAEHDQFAAGQHAAREPE